MNGDFEQQNIALLVEHFQNGSKLNCIQKLGLEVEHFLVRTSDGSSVTYDEPQGVEWVLKQLTPFFPHTEIHNDHLIGFANNDYTITLEPAAQIEISIAPRENPAAIRQIYQSFLERIHAVIEPAGYRLVTGGYQPVSLVDELPLIPKERYAFMDRYFQTVDTRGRNMMRGTASAQISIDYSGEQDFVRKIRCAYLLMPAIKLLTDNTAVFEGTPYDGYLCRTSIWNHVDRARCGIIPGLFDPDFGFETYARWIWNLPLIFVPAGDGAGSTSRYSGSSGAQYTNAASDSPVYTGSVPVSALWANCLLTPADIDHVLSMAFPDVRLKHYLEIRGADSMPLPYLMAYLALVKGIFFHTSATGAILDQFEHVREADITAAEASLMRNGYGGVIYGLPAGEFVRKVLLLAGSTLEPAEQSLLAPLEELSASETTLGKLQTP